MIIPVRYSRRKARIEIIPLIDIVFFLLAIFVMVSLSMVKNQGVPVNLPSASTSSRESGNNAYTAITVTEHGQIYFNKRRIKEEMLPDYLKELKAKEDNPTVFINGDEKALLGKVVYVLDEARKLGIKKVILEAKQL